MSGIRAIVPACLLAMVPVAAPASPPVPVEVLLLPDPNMDACPSLVRPRLPRGGKDGFLSLRSGPGTTWPEIARLNPDARMFACGELKEWTAVIVQPRDGGDCAIPVPSRVAVRYRGPCRHGWVARRFLEVLAG